MSELTVQALDGVVKFQIGMAILFFLPAGTIHFWQAWVYWSLFSVSVLLITLHFLKTDPGLIESRLSAGAGAEKETSQKRIQSVAALLFVAMLTLPGIERHFHASTVPVVLVLISNALVVAAFVLIFFVFRENGHASSIIEVKPDQQVISTGPYALVRHPMYTGSILLFAATPPALGSMWALVCGLALCVVIVVRLLDEERFLSRQLSGYDEYRGKVRYRLVPYLW